jgi:plastocyanin
MRGHLALTGRGSQLRAPLGALGVLVALVLTFAACGGGGGGGGATKTATGGKITITAHDIGFDVKTINASPGTLTVTLVENGALPHTFKIKGEDGELKVDGSNKRDTGTWDLKAGDYDFECTIPGHASQGMKGKIIVK